MSFTFDFKRSHVEYILSRNSRAGDWYEPMTEILPLWDITTPERVAGFISQCAHESNDFTVLEENLNYSASGLNRVFGRYFRSKRNASAYAHQPERIANVVYADRIGNGNTASGDGWKFRGRGIIQLTGRYNYEAFGKVVDMTPYQVIGYVQTKKGALDSACWYWDSRNINRQADERDVRDMTRLINGGFNGLADRERKWHKALEVLTEGVPSGARTNHRTVKRGSRGPTVRAVQQALGIAADGIFGPGTERAVRNFQSRNGLTPDGIVGPRTLGVLLT